MCREGALRKVTAPPGVRGQSAPAGMSWSGCFGDGCQTMTSQIADYPREQISKEERQLWITIGASSIGELTGLIGTIIALVAILHEYRRNKTISSIEAVK